MQYREFGRTGARVSRLGFGAMRLPMTPDGQHVQEEEAIAILRRAFELGVNYFDTAPGYCNRESEAVVGRAIKPFRDRVYVSTKNPISNGDGAAFRARLEESLSKLDCGWIDFYHMWGINWQSYTEYILAPNGPLAEARRAKEEGLIRHLSFSFHDTPEALVRIIDAGHFETMTVQYNLLDRANEQAIQHAHDLGLGVVIMGPVGGGRLAGYSETIRRLLPQGFGGNAELALRFVLAHPGVDIALSGMSSLQMVEENAATAGRRDQLSAEERQEISKALDELRRLADLYCTGCKYCLPCPNDVNIPAIFEFMNYYRVYGLREAARERYAKLGTGDPNIKGENATACQECGECEQKCPQHLSIIAQLKEAHKALGE